MVKQSCIYYSVIRDLYAGGQIMAAMADERILSPNYTRSVVSVCECPPLCLTV